MLFFKVGHMSRVRRPAISMAIRLNTFQHGNILLKLKAEILNIPKQSFIKSRGNIF